MDEFGNNKNKINLKDINSSFIIKNLFSFLSTRDKLNMIMYNKLLYNILSVDIKDFKRMSFKYKIGEKNGKGKEYLLLNYTRSKVGKRNIKIKEYLIETNILIFEGEYLNGKRNGKGKEYYEIGKIKYEGEYLNGKRNGKGKEYFEIGKIKYEGEYLNGKKWNGKEYNINGIIELEINNGNGKGKEYHGNGKLEFEGEYLNGERTGKGKEYDLEGKLEFEGEYLNDLLTGKVKEYFDGELIFEGE